MDKPGERVLCPGPENPLVDIPDILDGEERVRVRLLDVPGDPRDIVTVNKGDDHPDAAPCPFCIEAGGTVLFGLQKPAISSLVSSVVMMRMITMPIESLSSITSPTYVPSANPKANARSWRYWKGCSSRPRWQAARS